MNGRLFTESELEIVNNTNLTHTEVSKIIGRSVNSIYSKRNQFGILGKCKGKRVSPVMFSNDDDHIIQNCTGYLTQLAKSMNKPYSSVYERKKLLTMDSSKL